MGGNKGILGGKSVKFWTHTVVFGAKIVIYWGKKSYGANTFIFLESSVVFWGSTVIFWETTVFVLGKVQSYLGANKVLFRAKCSCIWGKYRHILTNKVIFWQHTG